MFSPWQNKEKVELMIAYQCDNAAIAELSQPPTVNRAVGDGCRSALGPYGVDKRCSQPLFVWSKGSQGEMMPQGKGIKANEVSALGHFRARFLSKPAELGMEECLFCRRRIDWH